MLSKVIELSGLFLMVDLKAAVEARSIKMVCKENIKDMSKMAESFSCKKLSSACVKFIVEEGVDGHERGRCEAGACHCCGLPKGLQGVKADFKEEEARFRGHWAFTIQRTLGI